MRKVFIATVLISAAALWQAAFPARAAEDKPLAYFYSVEGDVKVKAAGDAKWEAAEAQVLLYVDDLVKTERDGKAVIRFNSGHIVKLDPLADLHIALAVENANSEKINLDLNMGRTFIKVKKVSGVDTNFNVKTPTAVAGVRGTEFIIQVNQDSSSVITLLSGSLEVTADQGVSTMEQNQWITINPGQGGPPPMPTAAPADVLLQGKAESAEIQKIDSDAGPPGHSDAGDKDKGTDKDKGGDTGKDSDKGGADVSTAGGQEANTDTTTGVDAINDADVIEETIRDTIEEIIREDPATGITHGTELDDYPPLPPDR